MGNLKVIIYESSSTGGCYNYALQLSKHYSENPEVSSCELILPANAGVPETKKNSQKKILLADSKFGNRWIGRLYFLIRVHSNPLIFFFYLLSKQRSFILFNDFEQLSVWLWVPLYRLFLRRHFFGIFLHDPDRDAYPPNKRVSTWSMKQLMNLSRIALYHDFLPQKTYYQNSTTKFIAVKHGIYPPGAPDNSMVNKIIEKASGRRIIGIIGNLRDEKNYEAAIEIVAMHGNLFLLIAGQSSSSNFSEDYLQHTISSRLKSDKYVFVNKYLSQEELSATILVSDIIWLLYKSSFVSQSGILNNVASFQKPVVTFQHDNSLSEAVRKYNLGVCLDKLEPETFHNKLEELLDGNRFKKENHWAHYIQEVAWEKQVRLVLGEINKE